VVCVGSGPISFFPRYCPYERKFCETPTVFCQTPPPTSQRDHHQQTPPLPTVPMDSKNLKYEDLEQFIYSAISEQYNDLGQIDLGEESLTVLPNVFAQIGVLTTEGVSDMMKKAISPPLTSNDVFCDLGSGVGNVCVQVLCDSCCRSVVGVEVIPSRWRHSVTAFEKAQELFPSKFPPEKKAVFVKEDIADCAPSLRKEQVSVLFTHSWMFDDELMAKLSRIVTEVPTLRCVISSRPLDPSILRCNGFNAERSEKAFVADWNPESPFYVYWRKTQNQHSD